LASGELVGEALAQIWHADRAQHFLDPFANLPLGPTRDTQAKSNVVSYGHVREQGIGLKDHPDVALVRGSSGDIDTVELDPPFSGKLESSDHAQSRGLATSTGPEERHQFAFFNFQIEILDGGSLCKVFAQVG